MNQASFAAKVAVYDKFVERVQECGDLYVRFLEVGWDGESALKPADAATRANLQQALAWIVIAGRGAVASVAADIDGTNPTEPHGWDF